MKKRIAEGRGGVGGWSERESGVWMEVGRGERQREVEGMGAGEERKRKASGEGETQRGE